MVTIEIDGRKLEAENGALLIEVADKAGIFIPRFCYHDKLSIAANCRMCLVDVEKSVKPLPACATPVVEGMKVRTKSAKALAAQRGTMEFLLINHPLDCPICDQGGECMLQDTAMGYGNDASHYHEEKRVVKDKNLGPLISTDMTRCIHCTRCVRFGQEIAGVMELGATGRGEHMEIGTYIEQSVDSELSGNVIDLCPVGALTSKPFRYTSRPWELSASDAIAPHDCIGSNIVIHSRFNEIKRVLPRVNEEINQCWLSDRDRFSYEGLNSNDRLLQPMVREQSGWREVDWETALTRVARGLVSIKENHGAHQIGALLSPSATVEESYLLQKLMRGMGSSNIDHRLRQLDFSDDDIAPVYPSLGMPIRELEDLNAVLLVGSYIRKEQPLAALRLRKATQKGGRVMFVNAQDYRFNFDVTQSIVVAPSRYINELAGLCKALIQQGEKPAEGIAELVRDAEVSEAQQAIAAQLRNGEKSAVILGTQSMHHPQFAVLRALGRAIAEMSDSSFGYLSDGANAAGAALAGAVPQRVAAGAPASRAGMNTQQMCDNSLKAYLLLGVEPEFDLARPRAASKAFAGAELTVLLTPYVTAAMREYADVLLPVSPFSETSGTYVNVEGRWQSFSGAIAPAGETRPAWKVLRVLGNFCHIDGFDYVSSEDVLREVKALVHAKPDLKGAWRCPAHLNGVSSELQSAGAVPLYAVDAIVRRAPALQQTADAGSAASAAINRRSAIKHGLDGASEIHLSCKEGQAVLPLVIDDTVADNCVYIPAGSPLTRLFDGCSGSVQIQRQ